MALTIPNGTTYTVPTSFQTEEDNTTNHTATNNITGINTNSLSINYFLGTPGTTYTVSGDTDISGKGSVIIFNVKTPSGSDKNINYYYQGYYKNGISDGTNNENNYTLIFTTNKNGSGNKVAITSASSYSLYERSDSTLGDNIGINNPISSAPYTYINDGSLPEFSIAECFLAGALIETTAGFKAIETMSQGDEIVTYRKGVTAPKKITAVLKRHIVVRDRMDFPIRFRASAIADGIPSSDLIVSSEHCMHFNDHFIPARMLVNGRTITFDDHRKSFDVYHIEFDAHMIINANGMLTESLLATDKSHQLSNGAVLQSVGSKTWENDAAAPLMTAMAFVAPLHRQFDERATALGFAGRQDVQLTQDPDFHLITQDGEVLRPHCIAEKNHFIFHLKHDTSAVRLVSRTARPSETIGPFCDDRRDLGVLVGEIFLCGAELRQEVTEHLTTEALTGWHVREASSMRWTTGDALINIGRASMVKARRLSIQVISAGPYIAENSCSAALSA